MAWKWFGVVGICSLVLLGLMQIVGPGTHDRNVPSSKAIQAHLQMPEDVQHIVNRACRDCHTEHTYWRWYTHIAPVSWLTAADVNTARDHMNLSEWGNYPRDRQAKLIHHMCDMVRKDKMPLWYYQPFHPNSYLSKSDVQTLCNWTEEAAKQLGDTHQTVTNRPVMTK